MDWDNYAAVNNQAVGAIYGTPIILAPGGVVPPITFDSISFDADYEVVEMLDGVPVSSQRPMAEIRLSDIAPVVPVREMALAIKGISYTISDIQLDGRGAARLYLTEA